MASPPNAPTRRGSMARVAVVLVLGSASASIAGACADDSATVDVAAEGGGGVGSLERTACPSKQPQDGRECRLPEGTTCDFGRCGTRLARCTRGAWKLALNPAPAPPCPADPPTPSVPCPDCWPSGATCFYDASANIAVASCSRNGWVLDIRPSGDGGGADVQEGG